MEHIDYVEFTHLQTSIAMRTYGKCFGLSKDAVAFSLAKQAVSGHFPTLHHIPATESTAICSHLKKKKKKKKWAVTNVTHIFWRCPYWSWPLVFFCCFFFYKKEGMIWKGLPIKFLKLFFWCVCTDLVVSRNKGWKTILQNYPLV